jgi:lipoate-protein ligase A
VVQAPVQDGPRWRLVLDGDLPGALNMGRDWVLLEGVAADAAPPTLRLYGWRPPCLSLGRHQGTDAADLELCRAAGVDVVRRPTGGRAVLHHLELTYAVAAALGRGPMPRALQEAYRLICTGLVAACAALGVATELTGGEVNLELPGPRSVVPCFKAPAGGEVVVAGRKLVGSAMRAHDGAVLQHGAILLDWDGQLQAGSMGLDDDTGLRPFVTTLREQLGRVPGRGELDDALARGFSEALGIALEPADLSAAEARRAESMADSFRVG